LTDKLVQATNRLARAIPEDWLIDLMQEKRTSYLDLAPSAVLGWLQSEAMDGCWGAAEITAFIRAIEHINRWLSERDLLPEDGDLGSVPTWRITSCLREYRDDKRKGFAEKSTHARGTSCASALAEVPMAPTARPGHTGASSGQYFLRGLKFGRDKLKSPIKSEDIKLSSTLDGGQTAPPRPAESTTLFIVTALEAFLQRSGTSIVHSHLAAAYLFLCYACMRCKQSTDCWMTGIVEGEFVEGFVACEKNPKRGKRFPRPWWAPLGPECH
jgi:hypothetical protein